MRIAIIAAALGALLCACAQGAAPASRAEYLARMDHALDEVERALAGRPPHRLVFSANLFFAHGAAVRHFPVETLTRYADGLRAAGAQRIDINPGLAPFLRDDPETLAKYDALVRHVRGLGLELAINPQFSEGDVRVRALADWQDAAVTAYAEMARRYRPDVFNLVHEPTTMARRMRIGTSPADWARFVAATAPAVRAAAPGTRLSAGGLPSEEDHLAAFLRMPELDSISLNIYDLASLAPANAVVAAARRAGKGVYVAETWRNPHIERGTRPASLEQYISTGVGDPAFATLDARWLAATVRWASAWGMEAVTPFWTQTFFVYRSGAGALDPRYNAAVAEALRAPDCTAPCRRYRDLAAELARR